MDTCFSRQRLIQYEKREIEQLYHEQNTTKSKAINHLISSLYNFMTASRFSIQQKSVCLSIIIPTIVKCLQHHLSMEKCRDQLSEQLQSQSQIYVKVSPILKRNQVNLIFEELSQSFLCIYEYYLFIFDDDESVSIQTVQHSKPVIERKLQNPVDVNSVGVLLPFVSKIKEPEKGSKKK